MEYTRSNAHQVHQSGRRMHQESGAVPTVVSAADMNMVIWSLVHLIESAGISTKTFNPDDPDSYDKVRQAVIELSVDAATAGAVGFTPVQQGGGVGQSGLKINIGATAAGVGVQAGGTNLGTIATEYNRAMFYRGTFPAAQIDTLMTAGFYAIEYSGQSTALLVLDTDSSTGVVQIEYFFYGAGASRWRNKTDHNVWSPWATTWDSRNFNPANYAALDGATFSGVVHAPYFLTNGGFRFSESGDDTGFDTVSDGIFRAIANGVQVFTVGTGGTGFTLPAYAPTPLASDSSTRVATTAHVKDYLLNVALTGSIGLPGSQRLSPNGFQVRYGVAPSSVVGGGGANPVDATFQTAFPNACLAVFVTLTGNSGSRNVEWSPTGTTAASARIIYNSQNSTTVTMQAVYLAIGY